jgi:uncharacterized protein
MEATSGHRTRLVYDPIYGFIRLSPLEWEIIQSPFYQRLRWIKQLGFSFYIFPGAEHSRFGHSIGVLHNSHKIIESCGLHVPDEELMVKEFGSEEAKFHQIIRISALMHDLGTFPFSHTTESSYIRFSESSNSRKRDLKDDHENLGSFIIKNTDYPGGITHILKKYGFNPQEVSDLVKGVSKSVIANQILHSEIDCDRMDYLLRDAHYTGLNYGTYDRDYLLHHFKKKEIGGHRILTIKHNALHCIEDFLMSRFSWYSQVIRSPRGAMWDALAERIAFYLLEKSLIYRYSDLLELIETNPKQFFAFNDHYFMTVLHKALMDGTLDKDPDIKDMADCLIFNHGVKSIVHKDLAQRLVNQDDPQLIEKHYKRAHAKVDELTNVLKKKGAKKDWIITDIPTKQLNYVMSKRQLVQTGSKNNVLLERDPVKIWYENGDIKLLTEVENSVISRLQDVFNFIPNVYCSESAYKLLLSEGLIEEDRGNKSE